MSNLDHEKKDELLYTVSRSSETPQVLDIEEPRLRLMPMEGRCPNSQYIYNNVMPWTRTRMSLYEGTSRFWNSLLFNRFLPLEGLRQLQNRKDFQYLHLLFHHLFPFLSEI